VGLWVLTAPLITFFSQVSMFVYISSCSLACFIMKHFWPCVPVVVMMDLTLGDPLLTVWEAPGADPCNGHLDLACSTL
jgi:hypothetical protein